MTPQDEFLLARVLSYATRHPIDADAVLAMQRGARSVVGNDPKHRAYLSEGIVVIFSFEDYSKVEPDPPILYKKAKVRHASVSQQKLHAGLVFSIVPSRDTVMTIAHKLGFTDKAFVHPSPDKAGPRIQHVLEELP